jgi:hypothetical protein
VLGTLLTLLTAFAVWQRETIYFILNPDKITIKTVPVIREALFSGEYGPIEEQNGVLRYRVLNGAVEIGADLGPGALNRIDAHFNMYDLRIGGIFDALNKAHTTLSPYLSPPEIKALAFLISIEFSGAVSADEIRYTREISGYAVTVTGKATTGDILVTVIRRGVSP